jgi:chaperonin GroES
MVPQLQAISQQQSRPRWSSEWRSNDPSIVVVKGTGSDSNIAATALPTNSIITLDGQEIRQEITAMNNIIFVKVKEALSTTTGGIVIPDQSKQRPTEGTVVACGPGKIHPHTGKRISNPISVGMNVI